MHLFNASSMFNEEGFKEILTVVGNKEELKNRLIGVKKALLADYHFKAYHVPVDFTTNSYIIATNHLTDSDAPLIISLYYDLMYPHKTEYPVLFVFAKENCFNGVSIPVGLRPVLELEKITMVDRTKAGGAMAAIKAAERWFKEGEQPKHFLIFPQGTIYDINRDLVEDIERGAFWLAKLLGIPVLPAFLEQAVEGADNRLVFCEPIHIPKDCRDLDVYKKLWLDRVIAAQNELEVLTGIPAREVILDEEHQTRKRFKG